MMPRWRKCLAWIGPYLTAYRAPLALALVLGLAAAAFSCALMFCSGYLISGTAAARGSILLLYVPIIYVRIFGGGKPILAYLERLVSHDWVLRMTSRLRLRLYRALEHRQRHAAGRAGGGPRTGEVLGVLAEDIGHLQNLYLRSAFPTAIAWALYLIVLVAAGALSPALAGVFGLGCLASVAAAPLASAVVNGAREERRRILDGYGARSSSDIRRALETQRELCTALESAQEAERRTREAYEAARERQEQLEEAALGELDFSGGSSEAAKLSRELASERQNAEGISAKIASLRGRLAAVGDPLVLASDLKSMEEEYDELNDEYDALALAADTLRSADSELQSRFSPQLGKLAAQYMSFMTGGRYSDVLIDRDFSARTKTQGDAVARDSEYLSAGTLDLMYLAVRLAVCELAMPAGETCPLIIDDALVNLDEERLRQAMALLRELSHRRQIILFTCREVPTGK